MEMREDDNLWQKEQVEALLNSIETGDKEPASYIDGEKFKQHNLSAADGIAGFGAMLESLSDYNEMTKVDIIRMFCDGDYVVAHTDYNLFGEKVGFDIFRYEDGKIVEHWDNLQEKPENANPSGRTMTSGRTEIIDFDKSNENKALIEKFANEILVAGKFENIVDYFEGNTYIQHNPNIGDGLAAFSDAVKTMTENGVVMKFDKIHKILGEGNFVLLISEGLFGKNGGKPTSFYDLFRIDGGKIAEHWDVVETILEQSKRKNSNDKFGFE
ncbi:MAG: nuclear transport factor 2 family protein [Rikenellaceae bacterium]